MLERPREGAIGMRQQVRREGTIHVHRIDVAVAIAARGSCAIVAIASRPPRLSPSNMYCRAERDSRPSTLKILEVFGIRLILLPTVVASSGSGTRWSRDLPLTFLCGKGTRRAPSGDGHRRSAGDV